MVVFYTDTQNSKHTEQDRLTRSIGLYQERFEVFPDEINRPTLIAATPGKAPISASIFCTQFWQNMPSISNTVTT